MNEEEFEKRLQEIVGPPRKSTINSDENKEGEDGQEERATKQGDGENNTTLLKVSTGVEKIIPEAIVQFSALDNYPIDQEVKEDLEQETARVPKQLWFEKFGHFQLNGVTIMDYQNEDQRIVEGFNNEQFVKKLFKNRVLRKVTTVSMDKFRCSDQVFAQLL